MQFSTKLSQLWEPVLLACPRMVDAMQHLGWGRDDDILGACTHVGCYRTARAIYACAHVGCYRAADAMELLQFANATVMWTKVFEWLLPAINA